VVTVTVLSPTLVQPRCRKSLPMVVFLVIAVVAIVLVGKMITSQTPEAFSFGPTNSGSLSADCPLPSTKSSDIEFLLEDWKTAGCHRMECLSDTIRRNTRDRLGHGSPLCRGQALCNGDDEKFPGVLFQFGLTPNGALVWQKCDPSDPSQTEIITLVRVPPEHTNNEFHDITNTNNTISSSVVTTTVAPPQNQLWFEMTPGATWKILSTAGQDENSTTTTSTSTSTTTSTSTSTAAPTSGGTTTLVWEQPVQNQPRPVGVYPECLSNRPVLDCPYIHFRRHGDIVMNYIDAKDGWVACKSRKICYPSLWE